MPHPLVTQLRFARSEFVRCLDGISDTDARQRLLPSNCISWMVGHLAAQEQYYFSFYPNGKVVYPYLNRLVGFGQPASTPPLAEMWANWRAITAAVDDYLDGLTTDQLKVHLTQKIGSGKNSYEAGAFGTLSTEALEKGSIRAWESVGTLMRRTTYHYFFHTGEAHMIRQQLGHPDLPYFVGSMKEAIYESEPQG